MNSEPVAYINVEERRLQWAGPVEWGTPTIARMDKVPLYTHQYSNLTDEEIAEIAMQCSDMDEYGHSQLKEYDFARAILRKAQEK